MYVNIDARGAKNRAESSTQPESDQLTKPQPAAGKTRHLFEGDVKK